jgi:hypothetical protein
MAPVCPESAAILAMMCVTRTRAKAGSLNRRFVYFLPCRNPNAQETYLFVHQGIDQCADEAPVVLPDEFSEDGGCRVYGSMGLTQSSGHFYIVPHKVMQEAAGAKSGLLGRIYRLLSFTTTGFHI